MLAALGVIGLIALSAVIITAAVLTIQGFAQGLTAVFRGHAWAGNLVAGILVLGLIGLTTWLGVRRMFGKSQEATIKRYEQRLHEQRQALAGRDAAQRSAEYRAQAD